MWVYERKLQHPVKIERPNARLAGIIISQLGGPDGELGAATRYLNQRYTMPNSSIIGLLTDIGSEELGHCEMVASLLYQLTKNLTTEEIKAGGFDKYFVDHTLGIYPSSAAGVPFTTAYLQSKGDAITDLSEDIAAEQKARTTYDNILRLSDDPDVSEVIRFLRAREVVHLQRFGEAMERLRDTLDQKNYYAYNPEID
jgi:spore coat protein JC